MIRIASESALPAEIIEKNGLEYGIRLILMDRSWIALPALVLGLLCGPWLSQAAGAATPSPHLCALLLRSGVPVTEQRLREYFIPAPPLFYQQLTTPMRDKLLEASIAMGSYRGETPGALRFAGENSGTQSVAHLWLLGLTQEQVRDRVRPLLNTYYQEHIFPGLQMLERGEDFRTSNEDGESESKTGSFTQVINGRVISGDPNFAASLIRTRDRMEIDSQFAEGNAGVVKYYFDGAVLAGDHEMAERLLRYMILLDAGSQAAIYGLEELNLQSELLALGKHLLQQGTELLRKEPNNDQMRDIVSSAVAALSRIKEPELKPLANTLLFQIAQSFSSPSFFVRLKRAGVKDKEWIDAKYAFYDLALEALAGMGRIVRRDYVDSNRVHLDFVHDDPEDKVLQLVRSIGDDYIRLDYRISVERFAPLRNALVATGLTDRLLVYGENLYQRRKQGLDNWFPSNVYWASFEFFAAAGDKSKAARTLSALVKEFRFIDKFRPEDRWTLEKDEVLPILEGAARVDDGATLKKMAEIAEEMNWEDIVGQAAALQSGESIVPPDPFPYLPEIPTGLTAALTDLSELHEVLVRSSGWSSNSGYQDGWKALENGDFDDARKLFIIARDANGMEALGDAYLKLHRVSGFRHHGRHFGARAHGAYLLAAFMRAEL